MSKSTNTSTTSSTENLEGLRCPTCSYDLAGLTQNRCPECGDAFDPLILRKEAASTGKGVELAALVIFVIAVIVFGFNLFVYVLVRNEGWFRANHPTLVRDMRDMVHLSLALGGLGGIFTGSFALCTFITALMRPHEKAMTYSFVAFILIVIAAWLPLSLAGSSRWR